MKPLLVVTGWLIPGGAYLVRRRYGQFALALALVVAAFTAGIALQGGNLWPGAADLQGLDSFAALLAKAGAATRILAGGPWLLASFFGYAQNYAGGCLHEYGTTLLTLAGLINLLTLADALELRKAERA